jgi:hypothetical protein
MYNTLLQSDDPAIIIECLNGYRLKERMPDNIDTFTIPLGVIGRRSSRAQMSHWSPLV